MIFKNDFQNNKIANDGFVIVDLLTEKSVNVLLDFSKKHGLNNLDGFSNSMNFNDVNLSKVSDELIKDTFMIHLSEILKDIDPIVGSFAIKGIGENGRISLHQDWSVTDEKNENYSYNIWCALEDVSFENGCMGILEKSHLQPFSIRGSMINNIWSEVNPIDINSYWLKNYKLKYIPLKKGQAIIYNQKTVHFSTENLNSKSRVAAALLFIPKNQRLLHYHFNMEDLTIDSYRIDKSFFFLKDLLKLDLSNYELIEKIKLNPKNDNIFDQVKGGYWPDQHGIINRMRKLLHKFIN